MLCTVKGNVISTHKNDRLHGYKLMVVQPINLDGTHVGTDLIAVDKVQAGKGDTVLVMKEGGSARIILNDKKIPVQAVIVAVVDGYEVADH